MPRRPSVKVKLTVLLIFSVLSAERYLRSMSGPKPQKNHVRSLSLSAPRQRDLEPKFRDCKAFLRTAKVTKRENKVHFAAHQLSAYLQAISDNEIEGWLTSLNIYMLAYLTQVQHNISVYGSVGEIGVHHGKFTIPIVGFADIEERAVAIDLFSLQDQNTDGSGEADMQAFERNMNRFSLSAATQALEKNSYTLTHVDFPDYPAFRLISVDGGHTHRLTLNDLLLTCSLVRDGGIVILDDFVNMDWLGVVSGAFDFMNSQNKLVPFLWLSNKLYFTTVSTHDEYVSSLSLISKKLCTNRASDLALHRDIFPTRTCVVDCNEPGVTDVCELMMDKAAIERLLPVHSIS
jgi:hypothetical protein